MQAGIMRLSSLFASRFLRARKSNKLLSFLSITSIVGVMLGVATLIVVVSVMDGFIHNLKEKFLGANPHITLSRVDGSTMTEWRSVMAEVNNNSSVLSASPLILTQAMLSSDRKVSGVIVRGVDPLLEAEDGGLSKHVYSGSILEMTPRSNTSMPGIMLGREMMFTMGVTMGSEVTLISPNGVRGAFGLVPKMRKFKVVGFFDVGISEYNKTLVYINYLDAQDVFMMEDGVNAVSIMVKKPDDAESIAEQIQTHLNDNSLKRYWANDWLSMNKTLYDSLKLEQYALFVILTLITVVASFSIVSMVTVTVKDKRKDIAILRTMGASEKFISSIFVRQGLIIGVTGTIFGNILALGIYFLLKHTRLIEIPQELYMSSTIPMRLSLSVFIVVTVCAVLITYIASVIPARASAKADPIEAIRND